MHVTCIIFEKKRLLKCLSRLIKGIHKSVDRKNRLQYCINDSLNEFTQINVVIEFSIHFLMLF